MSRRLALLLPLVATSLAAQRAPSTYRVAHTVRLGAPGGWDYLVFDSTSQRVFITRGTHVMVVDARTDSVIGDIADTPGVHGVALIPSLGKGYTTNGRDSSLTVFDYTTLAPMKRVHEGGANPDAITYDTLTHRIFAFNGRSNDAVVIDATTDSVVGMIPLGGKPESAVTDGRGMLWVNVETTGEIAAVDTRTLAVTARWSIKPCDEPSGLAIDRERRRIFAVCDKVMAVSDVDAQKMVATVTIGDGPDAAAFDATTGLIFASNGEGTISVVRHTGNDRYTVAQTVKTQRGARTMTLDPATHRLYTVTAEYEPAPAPTAGQPRPRPAMKADSFTLIVVAP